MAADTIAACATAAGTGGVAIVRISGPRALPIAAAVTGRDVSRWVERRMVRVVVNGADGRRVDDGLAVWMRAPRSFTGEDVVELNVHGGAVNVGMVLSAVVAAGARPAEPGEFTRRALEAGRVSVADAEAMLAVVRAPSVRAWSLAQAQLSGRMARTVEALRGDAAGVLAELEAGIDFPEEGIEEAERAGMVARLAALAAACRGLERSFVAGRALSEGVVVAVVGEVNAGKSSLVNALVGAERVIVADEPGTTRDYVEVRAVWDGVAVTVIDTAGERAAGEMGEVERRGVELGRARAAAADVVVRVIGPGAAVPAGGANELVVASKADLGWDVPAGVLATSAVRGDGVDALRRRIVERVGLADDVEAGSAVVLTERQRAAAASAAVAFEAARGALARGEPAELVALELRAGAQALGAIEGDADSVGEAVLDALFAKFCIGK